MSADPLVSVIAPAYNAASFFDSWILNIQAQEYPNLEVILVDDGSTDDLASRAARGPGFLRYMRQENRGPAAARNAGIRISTGELIAFLDLDDLWSPEHLRRGVKAFAVNPGAGVAQGLIRNVLREADGRIYYCSQAYRFLNLGCGIFRRWVFDRCGLFDETLKFAEDFDLITRCWEQGIRKLDIEEVSLLYQHHETNMTRGLGTVDLGAVRMYKRRLERIRAGKVDPELSRRLQVGFPQYIGRTIKPPDEGIREPVEFMEVRTGATRPGAIEK